MGGREMGGRLDFRWGENLENGGKTGIQMGGIAKWREFLARPPIGWGGVIIKIIMTPPHFGGMSKIWGGVKPTSDFDGGAKKAMGGKFEAVRPPINGGKPGTMTSVTFCL